MRIQYTRFIYHLSVSSLHLSYTDDERAARICCAVDNMAPNRVRPVNYRVAYRSGLNRQGCVRDRIDFTMNDLIVSPAMKRKFQFGEIHQNPNMLYIRPIDNRT